MKTQSLESLGAQLREDLARHEDFGREGEARTRRQLLSRAATKRSALPRVYGVLAGAALVTALAAVLLWSRPASTPLKFWVEERAGKVDEWVTARDTEQSLRFSDGSSVVAAPHTTTRVMQVTPDGAQLTLERGRVDAHVVHREASRWQVAAGPFVVRVTGTRFGVSWDPQTEKLAVKVTEGRVEVSGGGHPGQVLTAGTVLELSAGSSAMKSALGITPDKVAPAESAAPESARDEDELIAPRKPTEAKPDFRELSTAGRYREALTAVEQLGFASQLSSLGARDLLTLGSTARLAGRADRAREAYSAVRKRFPGSAEASISAFSLGRLASDAKHASDAVGWFQRYLSEQPNGPLSREAAGRLLELLRQKGNIAEARAAATSYLKKYPTGPHAALARSVLAPP